eukprot:5490103-Prymnesium_polylepis.1
MGLRIGSSTSGEPMPASRAPRHYLRASSTFTPTHTARSQSSRSARRDSSSAPPIASRQAATICCSARRRHDCIGCHDS